MTPSWTAAEQARRAAAYEEARAKHVPKAHLGGPVTSDKMRASLPFQRRGDLDWLFYRHWRLADGWLKPEDAKRALKIFNDPLAAMTRRAVIARLYTDLPVFAER
ncbi:MAG: hypothetical protein Kilf2KO_37490 [Rhodospirillales bacterium]